MSSSHGGFNVEFESGSSGACDVKPHVADRDLNNWV